MSDAPPPGQPLTVVLPYMSWRMLLDVLSDAPHRRVAVLIGSIDYQLGWQLSRQPMPMQHTNGSAEEHDRA